MRIGHNNLLSKQPVSASRAERKVRQPNRSRSSIALGWTQSSPRTRQRPEALPGSLRVLRRRVNPPRLQAPRRCDALDVSLQFLTTVHRAHIQSVDGVRPSSDFQARCPVSRLFLRKRCSSHLRGMTSLTTDGTPIQLMWPCANQGRIMRCFFDQLPTSVPASQARDPLNRARQVYHPIERSPVVPASVPRTHRAGHRRCCSPRLCPGAAWKI